MARLHLSFLILFALALAACSARAPGAVGASDARGYPGAPMAKSAEEGDRDGDAIADSTDSEMSEAAPAPPEPMAAPARVSAGATGGGAPPPAQSAPMDKPAPAKKLEVSKDRASIPPAGGGQGSQQPATLPKEQPAVASQMLVYTGQLHVRVREVSKAIDAVERLAKERGGYLVLREDNRITVRVPSAKFDATLDEVIRLGDLTHRNVTIEDVTDLYFDMQIRMKNLEVVKKRLEELLEKAKTVEESLAVQRQIERVTVELERLRGKLKLLAELVLFSTITVVFEPKSHERLDSKVVLPFPWMDRLGLGELLRL